MKKSSSLITTQIVPWIVAIGLFMENLDSTIVSNSIPQMAVTFHVNPVQLKVALTCYLLSLAIFIPISGWLSDRFGTRKIFAFALIVFTGSSLLCGISHCLSELVIARILQGFGGALMTPVGRLILVKTFPKAELLRVVNFIAIPSLIGPMLGPVVGGIITTYFSWHWIFYINIPVGLIGLFLILNFAVDYKAVTKRFDWMGFILLGFGLAVFSYGVETLGENILSLPVNLIVIACALFCLFTYFIYALRIKDPVLDLKIFKVRTFCIVMLGGSIVRLGFGGILFLLPFYFQVGFGFTPLHAGLLIFPLVFGQLLMKFFSKVIIKFFGFKKILIFGTMAIGFSLLSFALFQRTTSYLFIVSMLFLYGLLSSMHYSSTGVMSFIDLAAEDLSKGTSISSVFFQLSNSFGICIIALSLMLLMGSKPISPAIATYAAHMTFILMGLIVIFSSLFFSLLHASDGSVASGHSGN
jgi:EmrB/QacA subfamily drug resistance transporter